MKVLIILLAISPFLKYSEEYEKILCSHSWRVEYIKTLRGTDDPLSTKHISEIVNTPPLCGQVLTFKKDKTCEVQNRGKGRWTADDNATSIRFVNILLPMLLVGLFGFLFLWQRKRRYAIG